MSGRDGHRTDFVEFAEVARRRAPLYGRLSKALADSPLPAELFADAPEPARVPVNLLAAVHFLLLADPSVPLARFYPNLTVEPDQGDPVPVFLAFVEQNGSAIRRLVATRLPQTNEVGRSALLLAGIAQLGDVGPIAHVDVGASAGLNLMLDRVAYADARGNRLGRGELVLECSVRGDRPDAAGPHGLADALPEFGSRLGLDADPVNLADPDHARWLEACIWPDQADRFHRLRIAIELFRRRPVEVRRGDAVDDLAEALAVAEGGHPVVTTSWALCYLSRERQRQWVQRIDSIGVARDLSWVWAEAPARVGSLPVPPDLATSERTVLGVTTWHGGARVDRVLGHGHSHGYWLTWR